MIKEKIIDNIYIFDIILALYYFKSVFYFVFRIFNLPSATSRKRSTQ